MGIWQSIGFSSIIYIAALAGVDQELYEAAVIDGAGRLKQVLHISIPCVMPTIIIMLILRLGSLLKVGYESIILLYQPSTYETADVISTYVYRSGIIDGDYASATAVGLIDSVVALILTIASNSISKRVTESSLW
jgi:putative aldouronate transport system permease protein